MNRAEQLDSVWEKQRENAANGQNNGKRDREKLSEKNVK